MGLRWSIRCSGWTPRAWMSVKLSPQGVNITDSLGIRGRTSTPSDPQLPQALHLNIPMMHSGAVLVLWLTLVIFLCLSLSLSLPLTTIFLLIGAYFLSRAIFHFELSTFAGPPSVAYIMYIDWIGFKLCWRSSGDRERERRVSHP